MKTTAAIILASMATLVSAAPSLLPRHDDKHSNNGTKNVTNDNDAHSKTVTKTFLSDLPMGSVYTNAANSTLGRRIHRKLFFYARWLSNAQLRTGQTCVSPSSKKTWKSSLAPLSKCKSPRFSNPNNQLLLLLQRRPFVRFPAVEHHRRSLQVPVHSSHRQWNQLCS
jgi:hypothetical protein